MTLFASNSTRHVRSKLYPPQASELLTLLLVLAIALCRPAYVSAGVVAAALYFLHADAVGFRLPRGGRHLRWTLLQVPPQQSLRL